jgi:site-specific DNA recombinase
MLTVAYCRVSTEEQAEEGFSIAGQAEKLRDYARLHDLGEVTVISDPGLSGKNLERPGLQQILAMGERGHLQHVLVWRLDRLSRNLGDLVLLADRFGLQGVALHSFTERIDLSTATGRMFYNVLGSFAQFYREQLVENVRMGMHQAVREGRWINRPKTGYDLVNGRLVPNQDAPTVRRIFELRARGLSFQQIEDRTGVKYSTVRAILLSRIYLGEVQLRDQWFPGQHEPLISLVDFEAAHRGFIPGRTRRSREPLSGRVRCGLCGRVAGVEYTQNGHPVFRCKHRGKGCAMPRRKAVMLERAVLLGLRLLRTDDSLRAAIRAELEAGRGGAPKAPGRGRIEQAPEVVVADLERQRRKLLNLHYADKIGDDLYAEEEQRLRLQIDEARSATAEVTERLRQVDELAQRFEEVAIILADLDPDAVWAAATIEERRVLAEELVEEVALYPDHLEVVVAGAPRLNVLLDEVAVQSNGVRGGT